MHFCTFVMIGQHDHPDTAVARALEPFDESLTVEPYRDHLDVSEIGHMANHYGIATTDLPALARRMEDWRSSKGGVDARGLYAISTYNRNGHWDWYEIGGRWNHYIPGSRGNVIRVEALLKRRDLRRSLPYSLVTPDGQWLERQDTPWFGPHSGTDRRRETHWFAKVRDALAPYRDRKVVCVDVHS